MVGLVPLSVLGIVNESRLARLVIRSVYGTQILEVLERNRCRQILSPDSKHITSGSKMVRLWNVVIWDTVGGLFGSRTDSIRSVALSQDGKHIVSGSLANAIRLWDVVTYGELDPRANREAADLFKPLTRSSSSHRPLRLTLHRVFIRVGIKTSLGRLGRGCFTGRRVIFLNRPPKCRMQNLYVFVTK